MLNQVYNSKAILKVISKNDKYKRHFQIKFNEINDFAKQLEKRIKESEYKIKNISTRQIKGFDVYQLEENKDYYALKLLDRYLRKLYKVTQSDRGKIVRQIIALLGDKGDLSIIKLDIKAFYESINFERLIRKVNDDMLISQEGLSLLKSLQDKYSRQTDKTDGIPRGIGISATLSELFMEEFDGDIRSNLGVFYYARYVDDILLVTDTKKAKELPKIVECKLKKYSLSLNQNKIYIGEISEACFDYLGYNFKVKNNNPVISIAKSKVNKIKTRIIKSFLYYYYTDRSHKAFANLIARLRYLSGIKKVKKAGHGCVYAGNAYNYEYVTSIDSFKVFDGFINKILDGDIIPHNFTQEQKEKIKSISFYRAVHYKIIADFTIEKIMKLKSAWQYE